MLKKTLDVIVDPVTKRSLKLVSKKETKDHVIDGVLIDDVDNEYYIKNGIPDLIPEKSKQEFNSSILATWEKIQENGSIVYEKFPQFNCSLEERKQTKIFSNFCKFHGKVLDVGCGPKIPGYLKNISHIELAIGIDPLASLQIPNLNEKIDLIRGIAEFLPLKDKTFDIISYATSFDHVIDPIIVLKETIRVLKDNGRIIFWIPDDKKSLNLFDRIKRKSKFIARTKVLRKKKTIMELEVENQQKIVDSLNIPKGAEDRFHLKHYHYTEFNKMCESLNLKKLEERKIEEDNDIIIEYKKD